MDITKAFNVLVEATRDVPEDLRLKAATAYFAYLAAHAGLTYVQLENLMESVLEAFTDLRGREDTVEVELEEVEIVV